MNNPQIDDVCVAIEKSWAAFKTAHFVNKSSISEKYFFLSHIKFRVKSIEIFLV